MRPLKEKSLWLTEDNKLTPKSLALVEEIETFLGGGGKKKVPSTLMGDKPAENIEKYVEMFPRKRLPSGKHARSHKKNLETNFKWFFDNYEYSWETILKATALYIDEYERKNWLYMRTSQYFIKKQEIDKSITSDLADYCAIVESGGEVDNDPHFTEKVV